VLAAGAQADFQQYFGKRITAIALDGIHTVDTSLVRRVSGFEPGEALNSGMVQEAIRQLYALSLFADIQIAAEAADGGVRITIHVEEYPRLGTIYFEGNDKLKSEDLQEKLVLLPNQIVTHDQVKQAERATLGFYKEKGYFFAQVTGRMETRPDSAVNLVFAIEEGPKVKIKRVTVSGAEQIPPDKVRGQMDNKADSWFRSGNYKPDEFPQDLKKIVAHYKKEGFLDAAVLDDTVFVNDSIGGLEIQITVHEGRRYYFGHTTFSGQTLYTERQLRRTLRYEPGEIFSEKRFQETVEGLYGLLHERGRLYGQVRDEQVPHDSIVDINFTITENEPARVRFVEIRGNEKTKEKVIRRELSLLPGAVYRRSDLERSMRDLMVLNYFENIVPDIQVLPNGDVDVIVEVQEKSTGQISVGGGYSGQDGFVGQAGFSVPNFLGNGQAVSINVERGSRRSSYDLSLTEPWFRDTRTSVGVDLLSLSRRSFDLNYNEDRAGLGVRVGRRLRWPDRYTSVFLRGRIQDLGYSDFDSAYVRDYRAGIAVGPDPDAKWPERLSSLTLTLLRDSRDRAQFATRGTRLLGSFEYAGDAVGGFWHYHKQILEFHKYFPIYKQISLVFKARWGWVSPTVTSDRIPLTEKFQVGGTNGDGLVRGYEEGTAGARVFGSEAVSTSPESPSNIPGGLDLQEGELGVRYARSESMTIYNLELQFPIAPPQLYGLIFMDAGRGFARSDLWRPASDLWRSIGFGGRMVIPGIGTVGFDVAYGFDDDNVGGWRPHFQLGRGF
jgi:outer membrane protein insertion porin family